MPLRVQPRCGLGQAALRQLEARMCATGAAVPHMPRMQGAPAWFKQKREGEEAEKRAAEEAARRAERERKRREREERERKARGGKVVVVGAGPAGLTAALHLKVKRRGRRKVTLARLAAASGVALGAVQGHVGAEPLCMRDAAAGAARLLGMLSTWGRSGLARRGFTLWCGGSSQAVTRSSSASLPHLALPVQRHGVEVTVLEARDRVGGRVHSYQDEGFTAPVDLGASIITGLGRQLACASRARDVPHAAPCRALPSTRAAVLA